MRTPFDTVVREHGDRVLRVCSAVLGPGADAEDAWSETFLSALRAWPDLPDDTNVRAWLVTVAHRRAVDVVRRRGPVPVERVPDPSAEPSGTRDDEVWSAVAALPPRQRQCVAYRYLGEMTHAEVADLLGISTDASRRATADGVAALRRELATERGDRS